MELGPSGILTGGDPSYSYSGHWQQDSERFTANLTSKRFASGPSTDGIFIAPFEQGEIGPDLFRAAYNVGLEGLVSKRRDGPYRAGTSPHWSKVKNPASPAMTRAKDIEWRRGKR